MYLKYTLLVYLLFQFSYIFISHEYNKGVFYPATILASNFKKELGSSRGFPTVGHLRTQGAQGIRLVVCHGIEARLGCGEAHARRNRKICEAQAASGYPQRSIETLIYRYTSHS